MLEVRDLTVWIDKNVVINSLSFKADGGSLVLVKGRNGSGKSTLLRIIASVIPSLLSAYRLEGAVKIAGQLPEHAVRMGWVSYIPQDPYLTFIGSRVLDEMTFIREPPLWDEMRSFLLRIKERNIYSLSAGELYRLLLMIAISRKTRIIAIDEPSSYLDPEFLEPFIHRIKSYAEEKGIVVVIAENDTAFVERYASEVIDLDRYSGVGSVEREADLVGSSVTDACNSNPIKKPRVALNNISYSDGDDIILENISLDIGSGEVVCILGKNGSGKSTLLKIIAGLMRPSAGGVSVAGKVFYIPQLPVRWFFSGKVREEIAIYLRNRKNRSDHTCVDAIVHRFSLRDLMERNPYSLSVGESRRLAAALAYVSGADILVFDEPFIGADMRTRDIVAMLLNHFRLCGKIAILATHRLRFQGLGGMCDKIYYIDHGVLVG
ncbi:MAG: hypothetical protein DJ555_00540 [Desulfurococcaceae archaeon]|nr:MAG: hypothetical protein DJ555_00540 [Desulfurococcaceae archaeon]